MSNHDVDDGLYPDRDDPPGFQWTRPAYAAAALVGVIVLLAGYVLLWPDHNNNSATPPTTTEAGRTTGPNGQTGGTGSTPPTEVEDPPGPAGECPTDRQTNTKIPPPIDGTVTWDLYNGFAAPTSTVAGPLRVEDNGLAHCYEHSPSGAVLAAVNHTGRVVVSPDRSEIVREQAVDNEGREKVLILFAPSDGRAGGRGLCQIAGYQFGAYSGTKATVKVATRCGANDLRSGAVELQWADGDWKIVYPQKLGNESSPDRLTSLDDWVAFSGVGG